MRAHIACKLVLSVVTISPLMVPELALILTVLGCFVCVWAEDVEWMVRHPGMFRKR